MSNVSQANQHSPDEREQKCWDLYVQSINSGTENAYQSARDAGYSHDHARNITLQGWFKERCETLRRKGMVSKAEKVLDRTLDYQPVDDEGKINVPLLQVQTKVASTVVTTLGKEYGYSTKTETDITTGGQPIQVQVVSYKQDADNASVDNDAKN